MAGLKPAAVLCELMNPDGTMTRGDALLRFAEEHDFPMITIEDLVRCRENQLPCNAGAEPDTGRRQQSSALDAEPLS
jgi:hypothetical protein